MQKKALYGLVGFPLGHSLSPAMHNAAFEYLGIDAEYTLFETSPEKLNSFLEKIETKEIKGFNITVPHKVRALEILDTIYPLDNKEGIVQEDAYYVRLSGAINTAKRVGDKILYWNTDACGFLHSLEKDLEFDSKDKNVLIIGCGGAGRAIISALSWKESGVKKIYVYDINKETLYKTKNHFHKYEHLQEKIEFIDDQDMRNLRLKESKLLVNASTLGMKEGDPSPIDKDLLRKDLFVYDVVYNRNTKLICDGKSVGAKVSGGLGMLLYQGVAAFNHWTNGRATEEVVKVMRQALEEGIKKR